MRRLTRLAGVLVMTTALGGAALAADSAAKPAPSHETTAEKAAVNDLRKLSKTGAEGFRELRLTRLAIFDANPAQAKASIEKAQAALAKAQTDEAVFTKAEAALKPSPTNGKTPPTAAKTDSAEMTKPVAWLPVEGELLLGEDFVASPAKATAVAEANKNLAKGDQKAAIEKLKLAGVDVDYTVAVVPLAKTTSDVGQAAKLIEQGKYYEANAVLKQAEDGLRFDSIDVTGVPKTAPKATDTKAPDAQATKAGAAPASPQK